MQEVSGVFSWAFLDFLMKESKKRRQKQLGKLMAKSHSQAVNLPSAWSLMNPMHQGWEGGEFVPFGQNGTVAWYEIENIALKCLNSFVQGL